MTPITRLTTVTLLILFMATPAFCAEPMPPDLGLNADLHGKRVFPADNPWNLDISRAAVDPKSAQIVARIGAERSLHPDFGTVWQGAPSGIPYYVVSDKQAKVEIKFAAYANESDPGPYPVPGDANIEGGPKSDGDRHVLVIDRDNWILYELYRAFPVDGGLAWKADSAAIWDLKKNTTRTAGWTSADAAGLPIFPGLVRYDEVALRKEITHAIRFTVQKSRRGYVAPATHWAARSDDELLPPMGMRVRLRENYDISGYSANARVILTALKKYGMILADNGSDWFISGAPDPRWNDDELNTLKKVKGKDFEVVKMERVVTPKSGR